MKKSHLILAFTIVVFAAICQEGIYYKTLYLRDKYNNVTKKIRLTPEVSAALSDYLNPVDIATIDGNPYLKDMFATAVGASSIPFGGFNTASLSGIDVTKLADGLAKFIVDRTKQELNASFFQRFQEDLNRKELRDLKILFPETWKVLNTIGQNIYQYNIYITSLRESFIKDLDNEYDNLKKLLAQPKYQEYFSSHPELETILNSGLFFTEKIAHGTHPGEVLASYRLTNIRLCPRIGTCQAATKILETNIKNSVELLQILSASFRSVTKENYWVPSDSVKLLLDDEVSFKLYMGLLYEKTKLITFKKKNNSDLTVGTILTNVRAVQNDMETYRYYVQNFSDKADLINESIKELRKKKKAEIKPEEYYKLLESSLDLLEHTRSLIDLPHVNLEEDLKTKIKSVSGNIFFLAQTSGQLYVDVKSKNYSSAIMNSIAILDTVLNFNNAFNLNSIEDLIENNKKKYVKGSGLSKNVRKNLLERYSPAVIEKFAKTGVNETDVMAQLDATSNGEVAAISGMKDSLVKYVTYLVDKLTAETKDETRRKILKYGSFMAAVATAESSDDVQAAIENIALPAGSFRIKRESRFNVSLNSYCGLFLGSEKRQYKVEEEGAAVNAYGLTVPVGVGFNWGGNCRKVKNHASYGIFVPMVDIGAVAAFRFKSDSVQTVSKIQLGDIFSPGIFFSWGLPRSPISINMGYQASPLLRNVSESGNTIKSVYHRFSISLLVDIPLLNFHTGPRKK